MGRVARYSPEQIVAKLREHEKLQGQGLTIPQACKKIGISDQTFYRWRIKYGALKQDEAHRLKALEAENARLKRIVADQASSSPGDERDCRPGLLKTCLCASAGGRCWGHSRTSICAIRAARQCLPAQLTEEERPQCRRRR